MPRYGLNKNRQEPTDRKPHKSRATRKLANKRRRREWKQQARRYM